MMMMMMMMKKKKKKEVVSHIPSVIFDLTYGERSETG
jgi:hypothetical protein